MREVARWIQLVVIVMLGVAAVPLISNQWAGYSERQARRARAARHAALARAAVEASDWSLAQQAWLGALDGDPTRSSYREGLIEAQVSRVLERPASIDASNALPLRTELRMALAAADEPPARLLLALGKVLQFRGQPDKALERFEKAVQIEPKLALAHLFVGDALLKKGNLEGAVSAFDAALEQDPDLALALFAKGQVRYSQKQYEDAAALLSRAAKQAPRDARTQLWLGRALLEQKKFEEAAAALNAALALDPDLRGAHRPLAEAYVGQKRFERAVQAYRLAWDRTRDLDAYKQLGLLYQQLNEHEKAVNVFNDIQKLAPEDPEPHFFIAASAAAVGNPVLAARGLSNAIALAERDADAHAELLEKARAQLKVVKQKLAALKQAPGGKKGRPARKR